MNKAIFIDKDAEINENLPHKINSNLINLLSKAGEGLNLLQSWGYKIVVVSNQPGIARGLFEEMDLLNLNNNLQEVFNVFNLRLDGFYYCPHYPEGATVPEYSVTCKCRKPQPGLYFRAAAELNIDLSRSWMIGDVIKDMEGGKRAGCKTLFIDNGSETDWSINSLRRPDYITYDFKETAEFIISSSANNRFVISA